MMGEATGTQGEGLGAYWRCLRACPHFRRLWLADAVNQAGWWVSWVAVMALVGDLSHGSGLAVSCVLLVKLLPPLLLSPVCGVVADRCNRISVVSSACLLGGAVAACLAAVAALGNGLPAWLLFSLLAIENSGTAFYDTARRAAIPGMVPASQLHLANTLDTLAWSLTGADSLTYLLASWATYTLPRALGRPGAVPPPAVLPQAAPHLEGGTQQAHRPLRKEKKSTVELAGGPSLPVGIELELAARGVSLDIEGKLDSDGSAELDSGPALGWAPAGAGSESEPLAFVGPAAAAAAATAGGSTAWQAEELQLGSGLGWAPSAVGALQPAGGEAEPWQEAEELNGPVAGPVEQQLLLAKPVGGPPLEVPPPPQPASFPTKAESLGAAVLSAALGGAGAVWEGWRFVSRPSNRAVAAVVCMECCGTLLWGAVDVLNVRLSEDPRMQQWGDARVTLGMLLTAVALGCMMGPLAMNAVLPPRPVPLAWGVAASFGVMLAGLLLTLAAGGIPALLLATFVRELGSASLLVCSTLLLQLLVPNTLLGRMTALETALLTLTEAGSSVFGGAALDVLGLSVRQTLAALSAAAGVAAAVWAVFAAAQQQQQQRLRTCSGHH